MILYLDDDTCAAELVGLLRKAGHDVQIPGDAGLAGERDPVHFLHAIQAGRAIVSQNYRDFVPLHKLVTGSGGEHPGVLLVRKDNKRTKDMKFSDIASAIGKLERLGISIVNQQITLNDWQ